ncbi:MAG TPA: TonB-dependent receptor, partial [Bryobacteraceae bacterium]
SSANLATANNLFADLAGYVGSAAQTFNVTSPTSGYVPGATNLRHIGYDSVAGYVQDNWKVFPHVTVTLGLRYEVWTPVTEANSLYLTPQLENNNIIQTLLDPNATLNFAGGPNTPLYKTDKNNFAPNIGLAWDPTGEGKTAIRMGYSVSYVNDNLITSVNNSATTAAGLSSSAAPNNLVASLSSPPTIAVPAYQIPRSIYQNYLLNTSAAIARPDPGMVTPYVQQWTIGIQHEFKGTIFEASYVGNHGTKLIRGIDYNQVLYNSHGFLADFQRAQSNLALSHNVSAAYNPAIPGSQQLTVFPLLPSGGSLNNASVISDLQTGQVGELANLYQTNYEASNSLPFSFYMNPYVLGANALTNGGNSRYNALQTQIRKRTRSGAQFQFSYAFSKVLSNTAGDGQANFEALLDNNNPGLENARSPYDITHSFKANYYYELPFGEGKRWHGNRAMNLIAGGWAISGIWVYNSGEPFSVISGLGTLNRAARSSTTNTASIATNTTLSALNNVTNGVYMTGNGPYFVNPSIINPADGRAAEYGSSFNGELFFDPAAGAVGNTQRRMFTGPWQQSWDMSMKKNFRIYERATLDMHFDFFNYLNHPTFYLPASTGGDYGSVTAVNVNGTSFGKLTSMNYGPRVIQLGAYLRF